MSHNEEFFSRFEGLTFDDVVLVPGFSEVLPDQVDTSTPFARDISLAVPVLSAAMDRVTEARLAIAMARCGGLGVIHRNMPIDDQAAEVQKVKRSQSGMIGDPVTLPATATLDDAEQIMNRFKISGVPITSADGVLVGILTNRDVRFCSPADYRRPVREFMTSEGLVTAPEGTTLEEAKVILQRHRIEKLPLVDASGRLRGLITVKDIMKRQEFPNATRDSAGRLRTAAAVGVGDDLEDRVDALVRAGVDAVVIDTAHGNSMGVVKAIERVKASWPELATIAGNVVDESGVETLHGAGVNATALCGLVRLSTGTTARDSDDRRWRHFVFGRPRKSACRWSNVGDARWSARRHRRGTGRRRVVRRTSIQELSRHGITRGDAGIRCGSVWLRSGWESQQTRSRRN
jgi:IMP dehydrogenase